jgi:hypothetical protein
VPGCRRARHSNPKNQAKRMARPRKMNFRNGIKLALKTCCKSQIFLTHIRSDTLQRTPPVSKPYDLQNTLPGHKICTLWGKKVTGSKEIFILCRLVTAKSDWFHNCSSAPSACFAHQKPALMNLQSRGRNRANGPHNGTSYTYFLTWSLRGGW